MIIPPSQTPMDRSAARTMMARRMGRIYRPGARSQSSVRAIERYVEEVTGVERRQPLKREKEEFKTISDTILRGSFVSEAERLGKREARTQVEGEERPESRQLLNGDGDDAQGDRTASRTGSEPTTATHRAENQDGKADADDDGDGKDGGRGTRVRQDTQMPNDGSPGTETDRSTGASTRAGSVVVSGIDGAGPHPSTSKTAGGLVAAGTRTGTPVQQGSSASASGLAPASASAPGAGEANHNYIYLNTFPPDFPIETKALVETDRPGRGYVFMKDSAVVDSMLVFVSCFSAMLILTVILIKSTHLLSRSAEDRGKVDNVIGDDTRWAEGREVVERKIIWEREKKGLIMDTVKSRSNLRFSGNGRVGWRGSVAKVESGAQVQKRRG